MEEQWKEITGFESYRVSNLGRVRNDHGKILKLLMNGTRKDNLYPSVRIQYLGNKKTLKVHRLVLIEFVGQPKEGQIACHRNDIKADNCLGNLYWGTRESNAQDSIKAGTFKFAHPGFGENHHSVKYPDELIRQIKSEYTGIRGNKSALARKYNISQQHVSRILLNQVRRAA